MKQKIILLMFTFSYYCCFSQLIAERLIIKDTKDSVILNAGTQRFDRQGNYCFTIKQNGQEYFMTNTGKTGGFKFIGSTYSNGSDISYTYDQFSKKEKMPWYYKNSRSVKVFGPVMGKLEKHITSGTKGNIAITVSLEDSIYYYANGVLLSKNRKFSLNSFDIDHYDWCAFSENGNSIYYIKKDSLYLLYVNGKRIDSSVNNFNELHINDQGYYTYAEGRRPAVKTNGYDYMFFIHTIDTVIGPVRTVWNNILTENNSYYYSGDDNGPDYIIINDKLKKGVEDVSNVILLNKDKYFYRFAEAGKAKINANGDEFAYSFSNILCPAMNKKGQFAFYASIEYYLYKFINGKQSDSALTKYGVRATPVYISPEGESVHYFSTDDSVYLYKENELLLKPMAKGRNFSIQPSGEIFSNLFTRSISVHANALSYLTYGKEGFWIFNGTVSRPMMPVKRHSYDEVKKQGEIVEGDLNEYGFFSIQKTGKKTYQVNVNNKIYTTLENVDTIIEDSCFFNETELIFYGIKGLAVYQFKLAF